MVEGSDEADVRREKHAVAENVTGHVTDADDADRVVGFAAQPPEMVLDRFPGAAGGDAHDLVVVAGRPARSEGVTEPEPAFDRNSVRRVGERRRSLVGGDDEIRVVGIEPHRSRRGDDGAVDEVVRQVEQSVDEQPVAADHLRLHRRTVSKGSARHESALGPCGYDHRVLDGLGLHETEHLGAEVLRAFRPPDSAARNGAHAQVHTLHDRRVDEDLVLGPGEGRVGNLLGQHLESESRSGCAVLVSLVPVRPDGRVDESEQGTHDAVLVERRDAVELVEDPGTDLRGDVTGGGAVVGIERDVKEGDEIGGDRRILHQR